MLVMPKIRTHESATKTVYKVNHLRRAEDFSQGPHEGSIHPHELLHVHLVCLVQHHPHFIVMPFQCPNDLQELKVTVTNQSPNIWVQA